MTQRLATSTANASQTKDVEGRDPAPDTTTCPECDGRVRPDGSDRTCESCGLVVATDRLDRGPEWRSADDTDEQVRRTGAPRTPQRHDHGLSTQIGSKTDANGNPIPAPKRAKWKRLRKWHRRIKLDRSIDRNNAYANTIIRRVTDALDVGDDVCDDACRLFRDAQDANAVRGRSIERIAAAAIYISTRRTSGVVIPVTVLADHFAEIEAATILERGQTLARELGIAVPPVTPAEHVPRLASALDASGGERRRALRLARTAQDTALANGVSPSGFAAGCLYHVIPDVTQKEVAEAADVSAVTVRNHHRSIADAGLRTAPPAGD